MKKDYCEKCNKYTYVEEHHIVPRGLLKNGETRSLCPNCHNEFHLKLGRKELKNPDYEFHWLFYLRWVSGFIVVLALIAIGAILFY